jgi:hypothetical protein
VIISGERRLLVSEETAVLLHKLPNFQARALLSIRFAPSVLNVHVRVRVGDWQQPLLLCNLGIEPYLVCHQHLSGLMAADFSLVPSYILCSFTYELRNCMYFFLFVSLLLLEVVLYFRKREYVS